ncbi:MAG: alpha/beta fold hydrolase [Burkholderiaceae bacterium]
MAALQNSISFEAREVRIQVEEPPVSRPVDGETLLLIPGLGGTMAFWQACWPKLAQRHRLISFDHPGMGASADPRETPNVDRLAQLAIAILDKFDTKHAVFVGHSMGGAIAQTAALDHPSRVRAAVLSSTWARPDHYFQKAFAQRKTLLQHCGRDAYARAQVLSVYPPEWIAANPKAADDQEQRAAASFRDPDVLAQRIDAVLAFDRSADLGRLSCPALVVHCANDLVVPPHMSTFLAQQIDKADTLALSGGGHFAPVIRTEPFTEGVLAFIEQLDQP